MLENADFHIHSPFSIATSRAMTPLAVLGACQMKGISVLGCGDALVSTWRALWEPYLENEEGIVIIPTVELEGEGRIHHLILLETFDACSTLAEILAPHSRNLNSSGRPFVGIDGATLSCIVHDLGGLIGPAHAFTPWTGLYGHHDSIQECYGQQTIDFLELGLSADSSYGAGIDELHGIPFLTNSDAHSPKSSKIGREFTRFRVQNRSVKAVLDRVKEGKIALNAGFFPEQGKYNRTACTRCYRHYTLPEAENFGWNCPYDGGRIKKGVRDRAIELTNKKPETRPPYYHILPLQEIIQRCLGTSSPETKKCRALYTELLSHLGTEIEILTDVPVSDISEVNGAIGDAIFSFRSGHIRVIPGGGGKYGSFAFHEYGAGPACGEM